MLETTIEWLDPSGETFALVQSVGKQLLIGFEIICDWDHPRQVPQFLKKRPAGLIDVLLQAMLRTLPRAVPIATHIKHLHFVYRKICSVHRPQWRSRPSCSVGWLVTVQQPEEASGRPFCDAPWGFYQWLWDPVIRGIAFEPILWGQNPWPWSVS
jgi:hypothetical protein